ncbi:hypothetical protein [Bradyrhizobium sp. WSM471]|uniref:hypothetical protein n=1 Tax=Bradyrhizobium sp. WSM471 TaxID=319017 RepID=UPI00024D1ABA|nr:MULTISPECIES: hypothetical protein [Bradyrhizobium]EHR00197.1 hypothetical protein Bra471DRAFT_00744 [Bradyrhizobium sp. WSM471]UFW42318.1 hypothetical protein BcanWSM471_03665 [Bradyrhizobium canariense]
MAEQASEALTSKDITNFLRRTSVAIELDQLYVDGLPPDSFPPEYDDEMWRDWRANHREFLRRLISTAGKLAPTELRELTSAAIAHKPEDIGKVVLELFAELAVERDSKSELATADKFFEALIRVLHTRPRHKDRFRTARSSLLRWLTVIDPLCIARDPECGYAVPRR